jgi:hypothetical protein
VSAQRIIESTEKPSSLAGDWIVALAFAGLAVLIAGIVFGSDRFSGDAGPKWIAGAFLLGGAGMLIRVAFQTLDAFRFGRIRLHLHSAPAFVGGTLEGELEFPRKSSLLRHVVGTLACTRIKWHSSSGSGIRSEEDFWVTSKGLELIVTGPRGRAALRFDIPAGQPHSGAHSSSGWTAGTAETVDHAWELRVRAAAPGLNLDRRFPITVMPNVRH